MRLGKIESEITSCPARFYWAQKNRPDSLGNYLGMDVGLATESDPATQTVERALSCLDIR